MIAKGLDCNMYKVNKKLPADQTSFAAVGQQASVIGGK